MSWIYMSLILQAANVEIPVIDLLLPPDMQPTFQNLVHRLSIAENLPPLGTLAQMFDHHFHLPAMIQNALIAEADSTLGNELEEFIHSINVNWASDEYWASRTSTGARPGNSLRRPVVHPRLDSLLTTSGELPNSSPAPLDLPSPDHQPFSTSLDAHQASMHAPTQFDRQPLDASPVFMEIDGELSPASPSADPDNN